MDQFTINSIDPVGRQAQVTFTVGGTDYVESISLDPTITPDKFNAYLAQELINIQNMVALNTSVEGTTYQQDPDGSVSQLAQAEPGVKTTQTP